MIIQCFCHALERLAILQVILESAMFEKLKMSRYESGVVCARRRLLYTPKSSCFVCLLPRPRTGYEKMNWSNFSHQFKISTLVRCVSVPGVHNGRCQTVLSLPVDSYVAFRPAPSSVNYSKIGRRRTPRRRTPRLENRQNLRTVQARIIRFKNTFKIWNFHMSAESRVTTTCTLSYMYLHEVANLHVDLHCTCTCMGGEYMSCTRYMYSHSHLRHPLV